MPEQIRCPECSSALRVPDDLLGKNVKCPKCATTFVAEVEEPEQRERIVREPGRSSRRPQAPPPDEFEEEPPPEEEEDEDRPRRRRRGRRSSEASSLLTGPAIGLMVASGFSLLLGLIDLLGRLLGFGLMAGAAAGRGVSAAQAAGQTVGVFLGGAFDVLSMVLPIIIIIGAVKMMKLQNYGLALTSCILGMVPLHCCCILGLPFGIWGIVMLNNPDVKDAFS